MKFRFEKRYKIVYGKKSDYFEVDIFRIIFLLQI